MGLALGLKPEELGVNKHFVNTSEVLNKLNEALTRRDTP